MHSHGPWTVHRSREVYRDPWLTVQLDDVTRPDGHPGTYSTIRLKSGVCVIAIDDAQQVHLTQEFHYAVGRVTLEGVSGGIEGDEAAAQAAERELAEELGLTATRWSHLGQIDPFTAAVHSTVDLYLAQGLSQGQRNLEGTEQIEHVTLPLKTVLQMIRHGEITHAPSCVALLRIALEQWLA